MLINLGTRAGIALIVTSLGLGLGCSHNKGNDKPIIKPVIDGSIEVIQDSDKLIFKYELIPSANYHWTITDTENNELSLDYGQGTNQVTVSEMTYQSIVDRIVKATCEITSGKNKPNKVTKEIDIDVDVDKKVVQSLIRANVVKTRMAFSDGFQLAKTDLDIQKQIAKMKLGEKDSITTCAEYMKQLANLEESKATKEEIQSKKDAFNQFLMQALICDKALCTQNDPDGKILGKISVSDIKIEKKQAIKRAVYNLAAVATKAMNDLVKRNEEARHVKQSKKGHFDNALHIYTDTEMTIFGTRIDLFVGEVEFAVIANNYEAVRTAIKDMEDVFTTVFADNRDATNAIAAYNLAYNQARAH